MTLLILTVASVSASDASDISNNISDDSINEISIDSDLVSEDLLAKSNSDESSIDDSASEDNSLVKNKTSQISAPSVKDTTKNATKIDVASTTVVKGDSFNITLKDKNTNNVLSGKTIIFNVYGKNYTRTTDANGVARISLSGAVGKVAMLCIFAGDTYYQNTSYATNITLTKIPTTLVNSGSSLVKGGAYKVTLKDSKGNPLANKTVVFTLSKSYTKTTDANGVASLTISGTPGKTYALSYKFAGDSNYAASSGSVNLLIKMGTTLTGSGSSIVQGNTYTATLKDANKNALSNQKVIFTFGSTNYTRTTNANGVVNLKVSATSGKSYNLSYNYAGTSYYAASSGSVSLFVKTPTAMTNSGSSLVSGNDYNVTLKDSKGNPLANKTVVFTLSKNYTRTTDENGVARLTISGTFGKAYSLAYKFAGDDEYGPSSGSVSLRIKKATTLAGSGKTIAQGNNYQVTLKDSSGTALANQTISFTFGNNNYTRTTNANGVASLKISAAAGKSYEMSYKYAGTTYYQGSSEPLFNLTVKYPTSIANSGTSIANGSSYKLTLKDSNSKGLANKNMTLTFNGKTYNLVTDSSGAVSLKIETSAPGSFPLTYKFAGDDSYAASSGSVNLNVQFSSMFTVAQIISASSTVKNYAINNNKVPATVTVNGISLSYASFTYLMAKALISIYNNKTSATITLPAINSTYTNGGSSSISGNLQKANYIDMTNKLITYAESNKAIPNYINTTLGLISPDLYGFALAKALVFYSTDKYLPNYIVMNSHDVDGTNSSRGNSSQFKKGLNEKETLNETQIKTYTTASGYDAITSAIQTLANKLVSGLTSTWAKANALFKYVRDNISYSYYSDSKKGAATTLSTKSGNCCDQANLLVALCRAAKIPARFSHAQGCTFSSGLVAGHVWAQINVDGVWYTGDATSVRNELGNIHNWNTNSFYSLKQYAHLPF